MRRPLLIALLALAACPGAAAAGVTVSNSVSATRADGSSVPFAQRVRVWCGPWERDVPRRSVHVRVGAAAGPMWHLSAVVADVRRRPEVDLPHFFVFDQPTGAQIFATDGDNELSTAEEEASGRITFGKVRCGRRLVVRFRVRAVLGSEFFEGEELTLRGSFRASK